MVSDIPAGDGKMATSFLQCGIFGEDQMRRFRCKCAHFSFNKCPIYTDGASAKLGTNSQEKDNSVCWFLCLTYCMRVSIMTRPMYSIFD